MLKIYKTTLFYYWNAFIFLYGSKLEKFKNEKTKTTDEFLVKKATAFSLPPDFDKLPKPGVDNEKQKNDINKIYKFPRE